MPFKSEQNIRGVKRKRRDEEESQEDRLRRKLHRALGELRKAVKKAKTFEVQKTLKKLKDARCKDPKGDLTKDLEAQIEVLKHLSYDQLAHSALTTKLKKNKVLSAHPLLQTISAELVSNLAPPAMPGTPAAKVQSRVLSCKILASEVMSTVESLQVFLNAFARPENVEDLTRDPRSLSNIPKIRRPGTSRGKKAPSSGDNAIDQKSFEASGDEAMNDGWESGTVSGGDDNTSASLDDHDDVTFEHESDDALSGSNTGTKRSRPHGGQAQSEFLPSLSVGFARGESGSEFSDSETRLVDGIKKNRRGQRARRAIWEKKFGKNANHIKKQHRMSRRRLGGSVPFDLSSGKGNPSSGSHPTPARSRHNYGHVPRPNPPTPEVVNRSGSNGGDLRRKQERPLHPSWEAKKKYKTAGIVLSQGTKIVF